MLMQNQQTNGTVFPTWVQHICTANKASQRLVAAANNAQTSTFPLFKRRTCLQPADINKYNHIKQQILLPPEHVGHNLMGIVSSYFFSFKICHKTTSLFNISFSHKKSCNYSFSMCTSSTKRHASLIRQSQGTSKNIWIMAHGAPHGVWVAAITAQRRR